VDRALEQGKQVFAVPGRITDPLSKGCNKLLQEGASLCLSTNDILRCFSIEEKETERVRVQKLPKEERAIYQALGEEGKDMNALVRELKIPINKLYALLLNMEISGYCEVFGNTYHRRTF
jgi:SMF family DNA processing protein